jgi:hypothetical protein
MTRAGSRLALRTIQIQAGDHIIIAPTAPPRPTTLTPCGKISSAERAAH